MSLVTVFENNHRTVQVRADLAEGWRKKNAECPRCHAAGNVITQSIGHLWIDGFTFQRFGGCPTCRGTGFVAREVSP